MLYEWGRPASALSDVGSLPYQREVAVLRWSWRLAGTRPAASYESRRRQRLAALSARLQAKQPIRRRDKRCLSTVNVQGCSSRILWTCLQRADGGNRVQVSLRCHTEEVWSALHRRFQVCKQDAWHEEECVELRTRVQSYRQTISLPNNPFRRGCSRLPWGRKFCHSHAESRSFFTAETRSGKPSGQ